MASRWFIGWIGTPEIDRLARTTVPAYRTSS
jgi:hypothetical protein